MVKIITDIDQRSPEWHTLRLGSVGGSSINHVLAKGQGKSRQSLLYQLAAEILSGQKTESFTTPAMERGVQLEEEARKYYEFVSGYNVTQAGLIVDDAKPGCHVSPDGLIGEHAGIEIKVMLPHTYVELVDTAKIDLRYIRQCQHFLWVSGREWIDFIAYCPEITVKQMWSKRITPDKKIISEIETELPLFLSDLQSLIEKIKR